MDIKQYDLNGLLELRARIDAEIRARHEAEPARVEGAIADAASKWGYALTEVLLGVGPDYERRTRHIRFQHPYDTNLTWDGAGAKPSWVRHWEDDGGSLESLRVPR